MNFKYAIFMICIIILFSCKNPYFKDPQFNISDIKLEALPVDESSVRFIGAFGNIIYPDKTMFHNGIDIGIKGGSAPFYSCADGVVISVEYNTGAGLPGTSYRIRIKSSIKIETEYGFETNNQISEQEVKNNIFVKAGDFVKCGQKIANLLSFTDASHVHFGVKYENKTENCPLNYFSDNIRKDFERIFDNVEKRPAYRENICE